MHSIWTCQRIFVTIHDERKRLYNVLVHEVLHEPNKIRKFLICCISLTIAHKINYIDKPFTCSIVIVPRHWYAHSIKKLEVSTGQILETSLLNNPLLSWDGNTKYTATIEELFNHWSHPSADYA